MMQKSSYNALRAYQKCASGSGAVLGAPLGAGSAGLSAHLASMGLADERAAGGQELRATD